MTKEPCVDLHPDDPWADEIELTGTRPLRLVICERYKTSGLSGDEWRFSYMWQVFAHESWEDLDGAYSRQDVAIAAFYPAFRHSHREWHEEICQSIRFWWKGQPLAEMTDDGKPLPLLHAIGSIAWAKITARQDVAWEKDKTNVCLQPGCRAKPISTFRKIKDYHEYSGAESAFYEGNYYRAFCRAHLRRGDCGLDDADANYELVEGIGPDGNEPSADAVSPSIFKGVIEL